MPYFKRARELMARPLDKDAPAPVRRSSPWPAVGWFVLAIAAAGGLAWLNGLADFFPLTIASSWPRAEPLEAIGARLCAVLKGNQQC